MIDQNDKYKYKHQLLLYNAMQSMQCNVIVAHSVLNQINLNQNIIYKLIANFKLVFMNQQSKKHQSNNHLNSVDADSFIYKIKQSEQQKQLIASSTVFYHDWVSFNKNNQYCLGYLQPFGKYLQSIFKQNLNQSQSFSFFQLLPVANHSQKKQGANTSLNYGQQFYLRHVQTNLFIGILQDQYHQQDQICHVHDLFIQLTLQRQFSEKCIFFFQRALIYKYSNDSKNYINKDESRGRQLHNAVNIDEKVKIRNKYTQKYMDIIKNTQKKNESSVWLTDNFDNFQIRIFKRQTFHPKLIVNYDVFLLFNTLKNTYLGVSKNRNIIQIVNTKANPKKSDSFPEEQSLKQVSDNQLSFKTSIRTIVNQDYCSMRQSQISQISQFCFKQKNTYEYIWQIQRQNNHGNQNCFKSIIRSKQKVFIRHLETGLFLTYKSGVYQLSDKIWPLSQADEETTFRLINSVSGRFQNSFINRSEQQTKRKLNDLSPVYSSNLLTIDMSGNQYSFLKLSQRPFVRSFNLNLIQFYQVLSYFLQYPKSIDDKVEYLKAYISFYTTMFQIICTQNQKNIDQGYYYLKHSLIIFNLIRIKLKQFELESYQQCKAQANQANKSYARDNYQQFNNKNINKRVVSLEQLYTLEQVVVKVLNPLVTSIIRFISLITQKNDLIDNLDQIQKHSNINLQMNNGNRQKWNQHQFSKFKDQIEYKKSSQVQFFQSKKDLIKSLISLINFDEFLIIEILGIISSQEPYIIIKEFDEKLQQIQDRLHYLKDYSFGTLHQTKKIQKALNHQRYLISRQIFSIANSFNDLQYDWSKCLRFLLSKYIITFNKQQIQMIYQGSSFSLYSIVDHMEQDLLKSERSKNIKRNSSKLQKSSMLDDESQSEQQIDNIQIQNQQVDDFLNFMIQIFKIHIIILKAPFRRLQNQNLLNFGKNIKRKLEDAIQVKSKSLYLEILNSLQLNLNLNIQISSIKNCQFIFQNNRVLTKYINIYDILNVSPKSQNFKQFLTQISINKMKSELVQGYFQQKTSNLYFKLNFLKIFMDSLQIFISFGNFTIQFLNKIQFFLLDLIQIFSCDCSSQYKLKCQKNILAKYFKLSVCQFQQNFKKRTLLRYGNYNIYESLISQIRSVFQLIFLQKQRLAGYPFINSKRLLFQSYLFLTKYEELIHVKFLYRNFDVIFKLYQFYSDCQRFQNSFSKDYFKKNIGSNLRNLTQEHQDKFQNHIYKIQKIIIFSESQRQQHSQIFIKISKILTNLSELQLFLKTLEVIKSEQKIKTDLLIQIKDKMKLLSNYLSGIRVLDGHFKIIKAFNLPRQILQIVISHNSLQDSLLAPLMQFLNLNAPSIVSIVSSFYKIKNQKIVKSSINELVLLNVKKIQFLTLLGSIAQKNKQNDCSALFALLLSPIYEMLQNQKYQSDDWFLNKITLIGIIQEIQTLDKHRKIQILQPILCKLLNRQDVQQYIRSMKTFKQFSIFSKTFKNYRKKAKNAESERNSQIRSTSEKRKEQKTSKVQKQRKKKSDIKYSSILHNLNYSNIFQTQNEHESKNQKLRYILALSLIFRIARSLPQKFQHYFNLLLSYDEILKIINKTEYLFHFLKPLLIYVSTDLRIYTKRASQHNNRSFSAKQVCKFQKSQYQNRKLNQKKLKQKSQIDQLMLTYLIMVNNLLTKHQNFAEDIQQYQANNCFVFPFIDTNQEEQTTQKFSVQKIKKISSEMKNFQKKKHHYWDLLLWNPFYHQQEGLLIFLQLILNQNVSIFSDQLNNNYKHFKNIISKILLYLQKIKEILLPKKNKIKFQRLYLKIRKIILIIRQNFSNLKVSKGIQKDLQMKGDQIYESSDQSNQNKGQRQEAQKSMKSMKSMKLLLKISKNKQKCTKQLIRKQQQKYKAECLAYELYKFLTNQQLLTIFMKTMSQVKIQQINDQFLLQSQWNLSQNQYSQYKETINRTQLIKKDQSNNNSESASLLQSSIHTHHALIIPSNEQFNAKVQRQANKRYKTKVMLQAKARKTIMNLALSTQFQHLKQMKFRQIMQKLYSIVNNSSSYEFIHKQNQKHNQIQTIMVQFFQNSGDVQFLLKQVYQSICAKRIKNQQDQHKKQFLISPVLKVTKLRSNHVSLQSKSQICDYQIQICSKVQLEKDVTKYFLQFDDSLNQLLQNRQFQFILSNLKKIHQQLKQSCQRIKIQKVTKSQLTQSMEKQKQTIKQNLTFLLNILKCRRAQVIFKQKTQEDLVVCLIIKRQVQIIICLLEHHSRVSEYQIQRKQQITEFLKRYIYLICITYFQDTGQINQNGKQLLYDFKLTVIKLYFSQINLSKVIEEQIFYLVFDSCVSTERNSIRHSNCVQFSLNQRQEQSIQIMKVWIKQFTKSIKIVNLSFTKNLVPQRFKQSKNIVKQASKEQCSQIMNVCDNYTMKVFSKISKTDFGNQNIEVYKYIQYLTIYMRYMEMIASVVCLHQQASISSDHYNKVKNTYKIKNSNILLIFNAQLITKIASLQQKICRLIFDNNQGIKFEQLNKNTIHSNKKYSQYDFLSKLKLNQYRRLADVVTLIISFFHNLNYIKAKNLQNLSIFQQRKQFCYLKQNSQKNENFDEDIYQRLQKLYKTIIIKTNESCSYQQNILITYPYTVQFQNDFKKSILKIIQSLEGGSINKKRALLEATQCWNRQNLQKQIQSFSHNYKQLTLSYSQTVFFVHQIITLIALVLLMGFKSAFYFKFCFPILISINFICFIMIILNFIFKSNSMLKLKSKIKQVPFTKLQWAKNNKLFCLISFFIAIFNILAFIQGQFAVGIVLIFILDHLQTILSASIIVKQFISRIGLQMMRFVALICIYSVFSTSQVITENEHLFSIMNVPLNFVNIFLSNPKVQYQKSFMVVSFRIFSWLFIIYMFSLIVSFLINIKFDSNRQAICYLCPDNSQLKIKMNYFRKQSSTQNKLSSFEINKQESSKEVRKNINSDYRNSQSSHIKQNHNIFKYMSYFIYILNKPEQGTNEFQKNVKARIMRKDTTLFD